MAFAVLPSLCPRGDVFTGHGFFELESAGFGPCAGLRWLWGGVVGWDLVNLASYEVLGQEREKEKGAKRKQRGSGSGGRMGKRQKIVGE